MKHLYIIICTALLFSCQQKQQQIKEDKIEDLVTSAYDYTIVFASCNDQDREQPLWKPIISNKPDVFIWGGDNIYADTDDMSKMENDYNKVWDNLDYQTLAKQTQIIGTWDDHDYGKNDAGAEWSKKEEAQELFLNFLKIPETDPLRSQEGIYCAKTMETEKGSIKIILLDTRFFRTELKKSDNPNRRYDPWSETHNGTILGANQWKWLETQLQDASPDFTMIVSSIQFLSDQHGWEKWGNFPNEVEKMYTLIENAKARNIFIVSGDRHMAEVSVNELTEKEYPLVDFTSSGLTHTWITTPTEENPYRVSNVIKKLNFGVLKFDFDAHKIKFEIRGEDNFVYDTYIQQY